MVPAKLPALLMRSLLHFCLFKTKYLPFLRVFSRERLTYVYKKKRKTFFFSLKIAIEDDFEMGLADSKFISSSYDVSCQFAHGYVQTSQLLFFGNHHSAKLIFRVIFFWHDEALLI